jgi:ribose 5-phosphate isomerase A
MLRPVSAADPSRAAAAQAAVELIEPDMTLGIGSGRAVWKVVDGIAERWPDGAPVRAVAASERTAELARERGIPLVELDGEIELDLAIDGADEIDPELRLIKGGGGALLREKIVITAAHRFVVVAEATKRVERLGQGFRLPIEVVRFAWLETRRRIGSFLPDAELRTGDDDEPYVTDEGHYILDCGLPADVSPESLVEDLERLPGVVEHGLFIRMAEQALLGQPDGSVEVFKPKAGWELL